MVGGNVHGMEVVGECCRVCTSLSSSVFPVTSRNVGGVGQSLVSVQSDLVRLQLLNNSLLVCWCLGWNGIFRVSFLCMCWLGVCEGLSMSNVCLGMSRALLIC